jgi:hypothetical protein
MVLDTTADDFENIDQIIFPTVARDCAKLGLTVARSEIVGALTKLIEDGLVKAYLLSGRDRDPFSGELQDMPKVDIIEEDFKTYFYITRKGIDFHLSDDTWWPFDDEGEVGPTWHLDE